MTAHGLATKDKLVARDTLAEPIVKEGLVLQVNKKKFGPSFKKNAQYVQGYLDSLTEESLLQDFKDKMQIGNG